MIRINNTQYFHFLRQADDLRRSGALCDVVISVKSETFRAHRLVLACASRTLAQKLMQRDAPACCTLELFSPRTFQQVLDFTYNQTLEVSVEDLHLLLRAAQLLEMQLLEDQCQKQLDNLESSARIAKDKGEMMALKGEEVHQRKTDQDQKKFRERSSSAGKEHESMEQVLLPVLAEGCNILPPSRKKLRLSSVSALPDNRGGVIRGPGFSPAWAFPANRWNPVYTLRQMAQNYSDIFAPHPLQTSLQSSVAYPFSFSSQHMFPLLASSFTPPVHSSFMGRHQHYAQNFYAASGGLEGIIKQGLLKRSKAGHRALSDAEQNSETRQPEVHKASTEKFEDCARCNTSVLDDPLLQESASTPAVLTPSPVSSDGTCAEFSFCGRDAAVQHSVTSSQQDNRGQKPYQCQRCPKRFSLKHQLDTHHRVHTGEKPFECRLCGQRSRDYSAMIKHLRTHGGATPYQCTACREFCSSLVAMQKHVKTHAVHDFPPDWSITSTYLYTSHI